MKLGARELREVDEEAVQKRLKCLKRRPMCLILENVYDTYNVGGLFRLADALALEKIYLCGEMEIPPNPKIKKASIGTYKVVPWEYKRSAGEAIEELRKVRSSVIPSVSEESHYNHKLGCTRIPHFVRDDAVDTNHKPITTVAIEQHKKAVNYTNVDYRLPIAFVVGNETSGVTKETLKLVDQIVEIPMWGINRSLNVIVSAAIVTYYAIHRVTK